MPRFLPTVAALPSTLALAVALALPAAPAFAGDLTVTLRGVRAQTGLLKLALVDGPEGWASQAPPVRVDGAPPAGDTRQFVFRDLPPGRYALTVMHDENGNGRLDTNLIGMPTEGYGFSNNPVVMRKPTFQEAAFEMPAAGLALDVAMR